MRNSILKSLCALFACCAIATLSPVSLAQDRDWGFRIQFGPDIERMVRQAENHTNQLVSMLEERERPGLSERARELGSQLNMLSGDFDEGSNYGRRSQVASVLRVGQSINNAMRYGRVDYDVQRQWTMVRFDLNRLARTYHLPQIS
jgi:hypothetical protein